MRTYTYAAFVGSLLISVASADNRGGAVNPIAPENAAAKRSVMSIRGSPLKRSVNGICDSLPSKWAYMGW